MTLLNLVFACTFIVATEGNWYEKRGICYGVPLTPCNFIECNSTCESHRAQIVEPVNDLQFDFVRSDVLAGQNGTFLVGVRYDEDTQRYRWIMHGLVVQPCYWHGNEPRPTARHRCAYIRKQNASDEYSDRFRLRGCNYNNYRVICQRFGHRTTITEGPVNARDNHYCPFRNEPHDRQIDCKDVCVLNYIKCRGYKYQHPNCSLYEHNRDCNKNVSSTDEIVGMRFFNCN